MKPGKLLVLGAAMAASAGCDSADTPVAGGNPALGPETLRQYACHACHVIPGVVGATSHVGPALDNIGNIQYVAGVLPSTPENVVRWIRHPQDIDPLTAMPDLGVTEEHARNIAAYLYAVSR